MFLLLILLIVSYLAGSIPTAVIVSRIVMKDDIRNHGSKNAGATNVFRVMGWKPALFVTLVDIGKGTFSVLVIAGIGRGQIPLDPFLIQILSGVAAIIGHIWTVFAGFRGGKGMGTAFGVLIALAPVATLAALGVWLGLVLSTRIVSIGSLAAGIVFPTVQFMQRYFFDVPIHNALLIVGVLLAILVFITHRSNIRRLLRGEENRFGSKRRDAENSS